MNSRLIFYQLIKCATRVTTKSSTLLDHIYTNSCLLVQVGVFSLGLADHYAIYYHFKQSGRHSMPSDYRRHRLALFHQMRHVSDISACEVLGSKDWSIILSLINVNDAFSTFLIAFTSAWNKIVPLRQRCARVKSNLWMPNELLQLLHQRHNSYRHFLCNRKVEKKRHYEQLRYQFKYPVRLSKHQFFWRRG